MTSKPKFYVIHGDGVDFPAGPNDYVLRSEYERLQRYADKLAAGLPEGMLPKDVENLREANAQMATEIGQLRREIEGLKHDLDRSMANHVADLNADETTPVRPRYRCTAINDAFCDNCGQSLVYHNKDYTCRTAKKTSV